MSRYFAYGSCLNPNDAPPGLHGRPSRVGYLPDHRLGFRRESRKRHGGVLDAVPQRGHVIEGVSFEVDDELIRALDEREGVAVGAYRGVEVEILHDDGTASRAFTYKVVDPQPHVSPSPAYLDTVRDAFHLHGFSPFALDRVARNEEPASLVDALFVYGTLMRGEQRHDVLRRHRPSCVLLADAPGLLVTHGAFPALHAGHELTEGEYVRVSDIGALLGEVDEVEGFRGFLVCGSLFERRVVRVGVSGGRDRLAWCYFAPDGPQNEGARIHLRSWREHRGTRPTFVSRLLDAHVGAAGGRDALLERFSSLGPFPLLDRVRFESVAEDWRRGLVSEHDLARASGLWTALV